MLEGTLCLFLNLSISEKERRGFEPPSPVKDYTLSKRAHSASMRPLHIKRLAYLWLIAILHPWCQFLTKELVFKLSLYSIDELTFF